MLIWCPDHLHQNFSKFLLKCRFLETTPEIPNQDFWRWVLGNQESSFLTRFPSSLPLASCNVHQRLRTTVCGNFCFYFNDIFLLVGCKKISRKDVHSSKGYQFDFKVNGKYYAEKDLGVTFSLWKFYDWLLTSLWLWEGRSMATSAPKILRRDIHY